MDPDKTGAASPKYYHMVSAAVLNTARCPWSRGLRPRCPKTGTWDWWNVAGAPERAGEAVGPGDFRLGDDSCHLIVI